MRDENFVADVVLQVARKEIQQLKQQLESVKKERDQLAQDKQELISQIEDNSESLEFRSLELKLKEAVEVIHWYAMPSINHHAYHDIMGTNLNIKAEQFLAKYRRGDG